MKKQKKGKKLFLVCIRDGKEVHSFKFPTKRDQMGFVREVREKFPEKEFVYSIS
jgi:hypothetical protein